MRRHLNLNRLKADTQILQLVVVLGEFALEVADAGLKEDDALSCAFGALNEEVVDVLAEC